MQLVTYLAEKEIVRCVKDPKNISRFCDSLEGLIGLIIQFYSPLKFLPCKGSIQNHQREKAYGAMSEGNQVHTSKSRLPVKSHRKLLIPPHQIVSVGYQSNSLDSVPKVLLTRSTCMYPDF